MHGQEQLPGLSDQGYAIETTGLSGGYEDHDISPQSTPGDNEYNPDALRMELGDPMEDAKRLEHPIARCHRDLGGRATQAASAQ